MRTWIHIVFAISLLALMFPQAVRAAVPAAISSLVGRFVQQTDGVFGYQMLVPATWEEVNLGDARGYIPTNTDGTDNQILLTVTNAHTLAGNGSSNMTVVGLALLRQKTSLSAWTQFQEQFWEAQNIPYERVPGPPAAAIYSLTPMADQIQLVAYTLYQGKLLVASLYGSGIYGSKEQLVSEGLFTDFALMVGSLEAVEATASKAIAADELVSITSVDRTTGTKYVGNYHCHGSICGYDESYKMITRWDHTRDMIERLYEEHWYRHSDLRYSWLYNTYVTNDTYPCEAGTTLLFRSIGKHTYASQYTISDDWYPYRIDTRLRTNTYHVMNFGDNAIRWCAVYQPFY